MVSVIVSASLDSDLYNKCRENKWGWSELLRLGIAAKEKPNNLTERINVLETQLQALGKRAMEYRQRLEMKNRGVL